MGAREEIPKVERAIARVGQRLDEMHEQWVEAGGVCCPGCMFGMQHFELVQKRERQEAWLAVLRSRTG